VRVSKITFGNMIWFSFKRFFCGNFSLDLESFKLLQVRIFFVAM